MSFAITRYHDFSCGHRVVGHEGKCKLLHGHNYRVYFEVQPVADLDAVGRVVDFGVVKNLLCEWLEENWDHKMIIWENDSLVRNVVYGSPQASTMLLMDSIVWVPFNPTAENIAKHLVEVVGPQQLSGTETELVSVVIEETRKCSATYTKQGE